MSRRSVKEAIAEEVIRYVQACRDHDIRLAHIRYRTIVRLRKLV